jgi:hypothetical protein
MVTMGGMRNQRRNLSGFKDLPSDSHASPKQLFNGMPGQC